MNIDNIVFTRHALERGRELRLSEKKLRGLLGGAERLKRNFWRDVYKTLKYKSKQGNVSNSTDGIE